MEEDRKWFLPHFCSFNPNIVVLTQIFIDIKSRVANISCLFRARTSYKTINHKRRVLELGLGNCLAIECHSGTVSPNLALPPNEHSLQTVAK